jgi:hypothetical protein
MSIATELKRELMELKVEFEGNVVVASSSGGRSTSVVSEMLRSWTSIRTSEAERERERETREKKRKREKESKEIY